MSVARHPRPPELVDVPIEEIMQKYVGRFREKKPDWAAFEDAKIEGYKRAQHRFIGAGGSGKHGDPSVIPAKNFTLSIMYVEPGQGNAAHTHEVEQTQDQADPLLQRPRSDIVRTDAAEEMAGKRLRLAALRRTEATLDLQQDGVDRAGRNGGAGAHGNPFRNVVLRGRKDTTDTHAAIAKA